MLPRGQKPPVYCLLSSRQQVPDSIAQSDDGRFSPVFPGLSMPKLQRLRTQAFHAQRGLCCYCGLPKWQASPDELKPFGLRARTVAPLRCTAEHLVAQQDGGKDVEGNIAAACWLCNSRRHKRKTPPQPDAYKVFVGRRMAKGKWHPAKVARLLRGTPSLG